MNQIISSLLAAIPSLIPNLIILAACIYYVNKKTTADGIMLLTGCIYGTLIQIVNTFSYPLFYSSGRFSERFFMSFSIASSMLISIGWILFGIGLILLVKKVLAK